MQTIKIFVAAAMLIAAGLLAGCSQTAEGVKEDTERNAQDASRVTNEAMDEAGEAAASVGAATTLTPRLKTAVTGDPMLNDGRNVINIDSTESTVTLSGHVYSAEVKSRAEQVVRAEMKEANANQSLVNNLTIEP